MNVVVLTIRMDGMGDTCSERSQGICLFQQTYLSYRPHRAAVHQQRSKFTQAAILIIYLSVSCIFVLFFQGQGQG